MRGTVTKKKKEIPRERKIASDAKSFQDIRLALR